MAGHGDNAVEVKGISNTLRKRKNMLKFWWKCRYI